MWSGVISGFNVNANSIISSLRLYQVAVCFGTAVAEELPDLAYFLDLIQVQIGDNQFIFVAGAFCDELAARRAEITLPVKLSDVPGLLTPDAIDRPDKISIRDSVRRLL